MSEIKEKTNIDWNEISYHNVADRKTTVRGVIQSRTCTQDITGTISDEDAEFLKEHLTLPMKFEDNPNVFVVPRLLKKEKE